MLHLGFWPYRKWAWRLSLDGLLKWLSWSSCYRTVSLSIHFLRGRWSEFGSTSNQYASAQSVRVSSWRESAGNLIVRVRVHKSRLFISVVRENTSCSLHIKDERGASKELETANSCFLVLVCSGYELCKERLAKYTPNLLNAVLKISF